MMRFGYGMPGAMWEMMLAMAVFALAALIVGALLLRWLIRSIRAPQGAHALALLEERFARGEIGDEEFAAKRRLLLESPRPPRHP